MTAKQYMNRVRRVDKEIKALDNLLQKTRDDMEKTTQKYDSDGSQSTKDPHKFDRLMELESLIDQKISDQLALKAETLETIGRLKDRRQRIVLTEYYLNMKTWEQVAVEINYSWRNVMNIHGHALQEIQKLI